MTDRHDVEDMDFGAGLHGLAMGGGEAVLWIHGYTLDSSLWIDLWRQLPGWRHIGVDLPGHGRSRDLTADDTLATITAELLDMARGCDARRLVGLSFGSIFALRMALEGGNWFERATIAAPTISGGEVDRDAQNKNRELRRRYLQDGADAALVDLWLSPPPDIFTGVQALNPPMAEQVRAIVTRHRWRELGLANWRGIVEGDQSMAALAGITAGVQILVGEHDMPIFLRNAYKLFKAIPHARRAVIDGAGHLPLIELPHVCGPLLAEHLSGPASSDAA